jgi:hypothetical protein
MRMHDGKDSTTAFGQKSKKVMAGGRKLQMKKISSAAR